MASKANDVELSLDDYIKKKTKEKRGTFSLRGGRGRGRGAVRTRGSPRVQVGRKGTARPVQNLRGKTALRGRFISRRGVNRNSQARLGLNKKNFAIQKIRRNANVNTRSPAYVRQNNGNFKTRGNFIRRPTRNWANQNQGISARFSRSQSQFRANLNQANAINNLRQRNIRGGNINSQVRNNIILQKLNRARLILNRRGLVSNANKRNGNWQLAALRSTLQQGTRRLNNGRSSFSVQQRINRARAARNTIQASRNRNQTRNAGRNLIRINTANRQNFGARNQSAVNFPAPRFAGSEGLFANEPMYNVQPYRQPAYQSYQRPADPMDYGQMRGFDNGNISMTRVVANRMAEQDEMSRGDLDPVIQNTISYIQRRGRENSAPTPILPDFKAPVITSSLSISQRIQSYSHN